LCNQITVYQIDENALRSQVKLQNKEEFFSVRKLHEIILEQSEIFCATNKLAYKCIYRK